jgi:hypothetical protein
VTLKQASIGVVSLTLALSPALAQASPTAHGKPAGAPGNGPTQRSESGTQHAGGAENQGRKNHGEGHSNHGRRDHGQGHPNRRKCTTHEVAYIASGTLVSDTLTRNAPANTYSGQVIVDITRANRHASAVLGKTETYTLQSARVRGPIAVTAIKPGDRVKLIGTTTSMRPKCESNAATPTVTITKLVFHA